MFKVTQIWQCYILSTMPHNFIEIELRDNPFPHTIIINNMAFSLDCGTLWLEMAYGAFHTALYTKVTVWWFPVSFHTNTNANYF